MYTHLAPDWGAAPPTDLPSKTPKHTTPWRPLSQGTTSILLSFMMRPLPQGLTHHWLAWDGSALLTPVGGFPFLGWGWKLLGRTQLHKKTATHPEPTTRHQATCSRVPHLRPLCTAGLLPVASLAVWAEGAVSGTQGPRWSPGREADVDMSLLRSC